MKIEQCSCMRGRVIEFLIKCTQETCFSSILHVAHGKSTPMIMIYPVRIPWFSPILFVFKKLDVSPMVKYSALAIFVERFYPSLSRLQVEDKAAGNWLLHPVTESNMQLLSLISIWISSKIHDYPPLSVKVLKSLGDTYIKDQHFTSRDILEAEIVFMEVLDFQIGTLSIAFIFLEGLLIQLRGVAQSGQFVKLEACLDIVDLLYEKEETSALFSSPHSLAASVLVAAYTVTVPVQRWEFPVLPWVQFVSSCNKEEILSFVRNILSHVFQPD